MTERKQHGRRRATPKRRNVFGVNAGKKFGVTLAAATVALTIAAPTATTAAPLHDFERVSTTTSNEESLVKAVANFSSKLSQKPVTADPNAKVSFTFETVKSEQSEDGKLKAALELKAAEDAAAKAKAKADEPIMIADAVASQMVAKTLSSKHVLSPPLKNLIETSGFGARINPITGSAGEIHTGQDYGVGCGTEVLSAAGGKVVFAEWHQYGGGNRVEVDHGNGLVTSYNHLSSSSVKVGQKVERGDKIALSGTTGASTGCHLHFEVLLNDVKVDPKGWL